MIGGTPRLSVVDPQFEKEFEKVTIFFRIPRNCFDSTGLMIVKRHCTHLATVRIKRKLMEGKVEKYLQSLTIAEDDPFLEEKW